jgi:hypothetical protein
VRLEISAFIGGSIFLFVDAEENIYPPMNADERRYQEFMMRGSRANYVMYDVEVLVISDEGFQRVVGQVFRSRKCAHSGSVMLYQPAVTLTLRRVSTSLITRDFVIAQRVNVNADWY